MGGLLRWGDSAITVIQSNVTCVGNHLVSDIAMGEIDCVLTKSKYLASLDSAWHKSSSRLHPILRHHRTDRIIELYSDAYSADHVRTFCPSHVPIISSFDFHVVVYVPAQIQIILTSYRYYMIY